MLTGEMWRNVVRNQTAAIVCRGSIISNITSMDWRIVPRRAEDAGKFKSDIQYYTDLFTNQDGGWDVHVDVVLQDALDLPFGGVTEIGREGDVPDGRVMWYKHIDGATCVPTYNDDWPVAQVGVMTTYSGIPPIFFPKHAVTRIGYTPRPELQRKGWFMAPPEKIYLALELLSRGDRYYANLLLDTPEVGILDLGDATEDTATNWVNSWRDLLAGTESFKVPVLYEHTTPAQFISFGRSPIELAYDKTTLRYMQIAAGGYDLSLTDIGIVEGDAGTLAGTIRQERRSLRTGIGIARRKITAYFDRILPPWLRFEIVVKDEETLTARGRARLAMSMSLVNLVSAQVIDRETALEQLISDGVLTVPAVVPDVLEGAFAESPVNKPGTQAQGAIPQLPGGQPAQGSHQIAGHTLGNPVPASGGGEGDISARSLMGRPDDPDLPDPLYEWVLVQYSTTATQLNQIVAEAAAEKQITLEVPSFSLTNLDVLAWISDLVKDDSKTYNDFIEAIAQDVLTHIVPVTGEVPVKLWDGG